MRHLVSALCMAMLFGCHCGSSGGGTDVPDVDPDDGGGDGPPDVPEDESAADLPLEAIGDDGGVDVPEETASEACGDGPACGERYRCAYDPGCESPTLSCHVNTCGDGCAWVYCACDGATTMNYHGCCEPDEPYAHAGPCDPDGGE